MAQLKDTIVTGDLSVTGSIYGNIPLESLSDADDLKAIEALTGTSGILTKTAANTWSLSDGAAPTSHTHGNITNAGAIGTVADKGVYTGTNGVLTAGTIPIAAGGTGATTAAAARTGLGVAGGNGRIFYGTCSTAADTAAKAVTCASYDALTVGDIIVVTFSNTNTAAVADLTLNVNSKGAKPIRKLYNGTGAANLGETGELNKDGLGVFSYNGTNWILINGDRNTNTMVNLYRRTSGYNDNYPILVSDALASTIGTTDGSYSGVHAVIWGSNIPTVNPSTGILKAPAGISANLTGVASKATAANITTTANAIAVYSNTTGTFSTQATASGAAYATAANGALTFGTLPIAQGGTGATAKKAAKTNLGITYGTANPSGGADGDIYVQYNTSSAHPFLDLVYPVGSIYLSVSSTSPATLFGGTWARIKDQFLLAAGDTYANGEYGGEATHTLTTAEMPAHSHTRGTMEIVGTWTINDDSDNAGLDAPSTGTGAITAKNGSGYGSSVGGGGWGVNRGFTFRASDNWTGATSAVGSGQAHNNMPPYLAVYMWKRTA